MPLLLLWSATLIRDVVAKAIEECALFTEFKLRPQLRREYPLNLSISLSGGKENNNDFPSKGD